MMLKKDNVYERSILKVKEAAKRLGVPIIVKGKSEYHSEKLFGKVKP